MLLNPHGTGTYGCPGEHLIKNVIVVHTRIMTFKVQEDSKGRVAYLCICAGNSQRG
jgi:hypothetical protein